MSDTARLFTTYDIQACLYDESRVEYFRAAINQTVGPGDVVVDAGSGSGILGILAAQAGATKVYCVELNADYIKVIRENAARNGVEHIIDVIEADATNWRPPESVDVIISEVISGGFFDEQQLQIVENLRRQLRPGGTIIPFAMENLVELMSAQDELYGVKLSYDTRFRVLSDDTPLTEQVPYLSTDFRGDLGPAISSKVSLVARAAGTANAIRISYKIQFVQGVVVDQPTEFLMNPQVIFLKKPLTVDEGDRFTVKLAYEAGTSPLTADIEVISDKPAPSGARRRPGPVHPKVQLPADPANAGPLVQSRTASR